MSTIPSLPAGVRLERGNGGLERLTISTAAGRAEMYLQGAQLTRWQPRIPGIEQPVLWLSGSSNFVAGKPIRGGVPICFPWFGPKSPEIANPGAAAAPGPMHGFARNLTWDLVSAACNPAGEARVQLKLASSAATRELWPCDFEAIFQADIGQSLTMALTIRNTGSTPCLFEEALHTYFAVGDVRQITITGLEKVGYFDRNHETIAAAPSGKAITVGEEVDRAYQGTEGKVVLIDPVLGRRITMEKIASKTTVVWNPWVAKAKAMPDFGDDEWPTMVCIESANALPNAVTLKPGETHRLGTTLTVEKA